ncbi:hypothetical protein MF6394_08645 [Pseudomonas sp. MF6394]|nr:hypothetical protein MF6394_08645 [Pseudomonas sp. MF6394]
MISVIGVIGGLCLSSVGASLLAKFVNDDAGLLVKRGVLTIFASKLAPTKNTGKKKPRQVAGLRYERGARKSVWQGPSR